MLGTSARLLRLLTTLQSRRTWPGSELAARLEVTPRTLRRDVEKLRSLGYAVEATAGHGGGYRLGTGTSLPPLLLDDEEAIAVAVALRSATDTFAGVAETAVRVLVKLEQLLPQRLRRRVGAIQAMTVSVHAAPDRLTRLAGACRDCERVEFDYRSRTGAATRRRVEPLRLAHAAGRRWYLVAYDLDRGAWRTFRVDRIQGDVQVGPRFVPREMPGDVAAYVAESLASSGGRYEARVRIAGTREELAARVPGWVGILEPLDEGACVLRVSAETIEGLVCHLLLCGEPFELIDPPALAPEIRAVARRLEASVERAAQRPGFSRSPPRAGAGSPA